MDENATAKPFEQLRIPQKELPKLSTREYKVYEDRKKFVIVEADNAQDALRASGLKKAYRIERDNMYRKNVIAFSHGDEGASSPAITEAAAAEETQAPEEAQAAQEATSE